MSTTRSPKRSPRPSNRPETREKVALSHCPPGDPCERTVVVLADGSVWFSALCNEMIPVAAALAPDLPEMD